MSQSVDDMKDIVLEEPGLFSGDPGTEITIDFAPVGALRDLIKKHPDNDILVITRKPVRGKITGAKLVNITEPSEKKLIDLISERTGVNRNVSAWCIKQSSSLTSALSMAQQASLLNKGEKARGMIDPLPGDVPPWGILDAVFSGNPQRAAEEVITHVNSTGDAMGLFFQLLGFMRKVVTARVDGHSDYFRNKRNRVKDIGGVVADMETYSRFVMESVNKDRSRVVASFAASMATRCS